MEKQVRILIVDDEQEALDLLSYLINDLQDAIKVGEAACVDEALKVFKETSPDLVLLDIQMPGKDGFCFVEEINSLGYNPGIIFVTAFENYAIKALKQSAFDYILKPIDFNELKGSVEQYIKKINNNKQNQYERLLRFLDNTASEKVRLNTRTGFILLNTGDIVYCKADGNYSHIQMSSGKVEIIAQNLGNIECLLGNHFFFRLSRSYLVNLNYLSSVNRKTGYCIMEYSDNEIQLRTPGHRLKQLEIIFRQG